MSSSENDDSTSQIADESSSAQTTMDSSSISVVDSSLGESAEKRSSKQFLDMSAASVGSSNVDIPPTDSEASSDEDEIAPVIRKGAKNRIMDSDEESDEEEKQRHSMYLAESDTEDRHPVEDNAYSKATRRSINGFKPRPTVGIKYESSSDDESDSIIVEDSEDDVDEKQNVNEHSHLQAPQLSSTIRSPLQDVSNNRSQFFNSSKSHKEDSDQLDEAAGGDFTLKEEKIRVSRSAETSNNFNDSITSKLSSTSNREDSDLLDEAAGGEFSLKEEKLHVSRTAFDAETAEKERMEQQIKSLLQALDMAYQLPDKGEKLRKRIELLSEQLEAKNKALRKMEVDASKGIKNDIVRSFQSAHDDHSTVSVHDDSDVVIADVQNIQPIHTGKVGLKNFINQQALTIDKLEDIQQSIDTRPLETELATPPKYLKVELMKHQLHALRFMTWREKQKPRGGILADDMGLGKTLSTIGLILASIQKDEGEDASEDSESDSEDENEENEVWRARGQKQMRDAGTLIVCPASLMKQWEHEIKTRTKRGAIEHIVFHGNKRDYKARTLSKCDVVLTTYGIVSSEHKSIGLLFQLKWKRIVLDEGHVIRNHKSKTSEAVCALPGKARWVLTGTPIHNKEFDLFAAVKFLRCRPFNELLYWKRWIEVNKGKTSSPRVQTLLKSIMLRRTKQQLMESGEIESLPEKVYEQINVTMKREERFVYNKLMAFSKVIFANYMQQHFEKGGNFTYDQNRLGKLHRKFARQFDVGRDIQAHEILTLLLRLRQACCHPGLIKSMLQTADVDVGEIEGEDNAADESDADLMKQLENLKLDEDDEDKNFTGNRFSLENEVFSLDVLSSKIERLQEMLKEKIIGSGDKAIIVSQWTSFLAIIRGMLEVEGISYCELNGTVPVKFRNDIVVNFNNPKSTVKIMLLSLAAGGVGLNLVGANQLFLMDSHWNPQLEQQAQDRIYRFGQTKTVKVFKFVCSDTMEESIVKLQQGKLDMAANALTGAKKAAGSKLTMDDLKVLFGM